MPSPIVAGGSFHGALRTEFLNTYRVTNQDAAGRLPLGMRMGVPSTRKEEIYFYWESAPHPKRWVRGESMPSKGFKGVQYTIPNVEWAHAIEWHFTDRDDDQTGQMLTVARELGENFARLHERVFFQMILGTTDLNLLASVPTAPDGAALYSATDGAGGARFGATGGNLVSAGAWVATGDDIRADFFIAQGRSRQFQDTEGQPLFGEEQFDAPVLIIFNTANEKAFIEAFIQQRTVQSSAAVTNIIGEANRKYMLWPTSRITDDDWFACYTGRDHRALFQQTRMQVSEALFTRQTNERSMDTGMEKIGWTARYGYGVNLPHVTVKIDHT